MTAQTADRRWSWYQRGNHRAVQLSATEGPNRRSEASSTCETSAVALRHQICDGAVTIRPSTPLDVAALVDGRDEEFHRVLGTGDPEPCPVACIVVSDETVGWVDYDHDRPWLAAEEVNLGYNAIQLSPGKGYATRAVRLLMHHLAVDTDWQVATLLIHPDNERSLALARRLSFEPHGDLDGNPTGSRR